MIWNLGLGILICARSDAVRYSRSPTKVQRDDLDHYVFHVSASRIAIPGEGLTSRRLRGLDVVVADLARPLDIIVSGTGVTLVLPRNRLAPLLEDADAVHGRRLRRGTPAGALLGRHLLTLARQASALRSRDARAYVDVTARLAAACLAAEGAPSAPLPIRAARRGTGRRIREHIEIHLRDSKLSAGGLAEIFMLSRTQLYRLFERFGGVHHYIRDRRLHRAFDLLTRRDPSPMRVGEIAYFLGFANETHFSRLFREKFGVSPGTARAAARAARDEQQDEADGPRTLLAEWLRDLSLV